MGTDMNTHAEVNRSFEQYFRQNRLPHLWCPGCGNGTALKCIAQAIESMTGLRVLDVNIRIAGVVTSEDE